VLTTALLGLVLGANAETAQDAATISIPFEEYDLENGLHVILSEDHSVPFVQTNIWYRVGAKDEVEGRSGFAHLFEHLMFQGSEHMDGEYFGPLQRIGAQINGTTNMDRTNYFEGVPSEQLPLALWLEADRMGFLLPALTQEKLDNQKLVVRNERRQSYENRPYGMTWWWLFENLYPDGHPYHIPTIGKHEDIDAANLEDVKAFFRQWYLPNNASLSIAGDFDPAQAKELVEKYFGSLPSGPQPSPILEIEPTVLAEEVVIRKTDDVPHNKLWLAWHSPGVYQPGDADLDTLSSTLSAGKDSRLYQKLIEQSQLAQDVEAYQVSMLLGSFYVIEATAAEGIDPDEVVKAIDEVLADVQENGITEDEVTLAKINWEASFFRRMRTISTKANQLNQYHVQTGDTDYISKDLARFMGVTPQSITTAAKRLGKGRIVLHIGPADEDTPTEEPATEKEGK
jgi:zinc protease